MYCSIDDLRNAQPEIRLVEATDDSRPNETGAFQTAIAEETIVLACGIIDGYMASRYALPLPTTPAVVRKIAVDLSLHGLYERIGAAPEGSEMDLRRKRAEKLLSDISTGRVSLGLPKSEADQVVSEAVAMTVSAGRSEFTDASMDSIGGDVFRSFP